MQTTDQLAEETRRVIKVLQEGARRVTQIRELMEEHTCELSFEGEALEAAARRLAEQWDLVDSRRDKATASEEFCHWSESTKDEATASG